MPHICSPKHWNSEMLKGTCIWYWGGTCWADAVGSGHNCSLFGCFRKENYEAKKGWHKWSLSLTNRIVTELNVHHHKDNIMKLFKIKKKADNMAEYLLGSKPLSLNAPSVCWAITRQQKREKEKSGLMMEQVQNPTAKPKNPADY